MNSIRKERTFVAAFLLLILLVLAHAVHVGWVEYATQFQGHTLSRAAQDQPLFAPANHSPDKYRIAMSFLGQTVMNATHLNAAAVAGLFDFLAGFTACYLLYRMMADPLLPGSRRLATVVCFLALLQFPLAWVVPWQRPETLPSSAFVAVFLFSMTRIQRLRWVVLILVATAVQGLVRTDVPLVMGIATLIAGLLWPGTNALASRRRMLAVGGQMVAITVVAQAYLQYVRFPHSSAVPGTKLVTLFSNLHSGHMLFNFVAAALPFLVLSGYLLVKRLRLDGIDRLILLSSVLYLIPFFVFGIIHEVRLIVPFMLALCTVAAKFAANYLAVEDESVATEGFNHVIDNLGSIDRDVFHAAIQQRIQSPLSPRSQEFAETAEIVVSPEKS